MSNWYTCQESFPLVGTEGEYKVILSTCRWPNSCKLAQASSQGKVTKDTEDEAVQKGNRAARWHYNAYRASQGNPGARKEQCIRNTAL